MEPADLRQWAQSLLMALSQELNVAPDTLANVPFDVIAALHSEPPTHHRRVPSPQRKVTEHGYMSTPSNNTRPASDYRARDFDDERQRQRFR